MIVLTFPVGKGYGLFIGLEDANIDRMREYDPAEVSMEALPMEVRENLRLTIVGFVTTDDIAHVDALVERKAPVLDAVRHLARGFRVETGDEGESWLYSTVRRYPE